MSQKQIKQFQKIVWDFYVKNKRDLPWRPDKKRKVSPYEILVSEFMLQQTQVDRVVPKYKQFLKLFPTIASLAKASQKEVLVSWIGLGYNRRALFLKKTTEFVVKVYQGKIPKDPTLLKKLPGIGEYMSHVLPVFIYNQPQVLIETNIRTVYIHHFFQDALIVSDTEILSLIEKTVDTKNPREWYYALMDYGSFLKKIIKGQNKKSAHYVKAKPFKESKRFIRGGILKYLTVNKSITLQKICELFPEKGRDQIEEVCNELIQEKFIKRVGMYFQLR